MVYNWLLTAIFFMNSRCLAVDSQNSFIETRKTWLVRIFIWYSVFFHTQFLQTPSCYSKYSRLTGRVHSKLPWVNAKLKSPASLHFTWNVKRQADVLHFGTFLSRTTADNHDKWENLRFCWEAEHCACQHFPYRTTLNIGNLEVRWFIAWLSYPSSSTLLTLPNIQ